MHFLEKSCPATTFMQVRLKPNFIGVVYWCWAQKVLHGSTNSGFLPCCARHGISERHVAFHAV